MGNHEAMLIDACEEYLEDGYFNERAYTSILNDGYDTITEWQTMPDRIQWYRKIKNLSAYSEYFNEQGQRIILTHAGFTPRLNKHNKIDVPIKIDLLWDRQHQIDNWDEKTMDNNVVIVHGHTPTPVLAKGLGVPYKPGALWYCDGHKVDIDNGGYNTGCFPLLNLDTFEEIIINIENPGKHI